MTSLGRAVHAGGLLAVTGALAVVSGEPFVFPSLGPSAYLLATAGDEQTARRVVGGHAVGVVAGWLAYVAFAGGLVVTDPLAPFGIGVARLAVAGMVAVTATTLGMLLTDTRHAPACATTLIVSLGLLASPRELGVLFVGVCVLYAAHVAGTLVTPE